MKSYVTMKDAHEQRRCIAGSITGWGQSRMSRGPVGEARAGSQGRWWQRQETAVGRAPATGGPSPIIPQSSAPWHPHQYELSVLNARTGTAGAQAINSVSKLSQNKNVHMDIAIKPIHALLGDFKESSFKNFCNIYNIAKQIATGLKIEIES